VKKHTFTRKEKYLHATKVIVIASVLLPVYAGLLTAAIGIRATLAVFGIDQTPPED